MHAGLEVAVPGEHGGGDDVLAFDDIFNASVERAGVADASGAAVADGLEAELVELDLEAGLGEVIGHDAAAWAEAGFDGRLHGEALRVRFLGEETGGEHDARIGGVRAARDGGDEHGAVGDGVFRVGFAVHDDFGGLEGLRFAETTGLHVRAEEVAEFALQSGHLDAILRTLRTGHAGHDAAEVDLHLGGEFDATLLGGDAPHALRFVVSLDGLAKLLAAAGAAQVGDGFFVHAEEAHRRAILRCHVRDGRTIGDRQADRAGAVEFDEFADDTELAQLLSDFENEVSRGDAFFERSGEVNADDFRHEEGHRLAEHARFRFNAAHAPTNDAEAVDHRRVRIGADERIRVIHAIFLQHALGEVFEVHLMHDADAGRHDFEGIKGLLTPLQELVALLVALKLQREVLIQCILSSGEIDLHAVIDDEVHRHERLNHLRVLAEFLHFGAHGGQIDEQRHAREVLQHNAGDGEGDFILAGRFRIPVGEIFDIGVGDLLAVQIAQQRLQHDADGNRQLRDFADASGLKSREGVKLAGGAVASGEGLRGVHCRVSRGIPQG